MIELVVKFVDDPETALLRSAIDLVEQFFCGVAVLRIGRRQCLLIVRKPLKRRQQFRAAIDFEADLRVDNRTAVHPAP
jgi:hypothetical protein